MGFLKVFDAAFYGRVALWKLFVFGWLLVQPVWGMLHIIFRSQNVSPIVLATYLTIHTVYFMWLTVSFWRCSKNATSKLGHAAGIVFSIILGLYLLNQLLYA